MATLFLVRHGQASFMADDYDQLSELGGEQMRRLGGHLRTMGVGFDRALVGPLKRQRGSLEAFAAGYAQAAEAGPDGVAGLPEAAEVPALDEFDALRLMMKVVPKLVQAGDADVQPLAMAAVTRGEGQAMAKERLFRHVTTRWVRGLIDTPEGVESFDRFRDRVERGLADLMLAGARGETVLAVSSGGVIGAAMAWALGLDDQGALELSWIVRNASVTELLYTPDDAARHGVRVSVHAFNGLPHLPRPELVTYR